MARLPRMLGVAWVTSSVVAWSTQLIAALSWPTPYSLSTNYISDLGMRTCGEFAERSTTRWICSPGHEWFNIGAGTCGLLLAVGALSLLRSPAWPRTAALLLAGTGLCVAAIGLVPFDADPGLHDTIALLQAVAQWTAMGILVRSRTVAEGLGTRFLRHPLTSGLLAVSVLGFVGFLLSQESGRFLHVGVGLWERCAFDSLQIWILLVGAWSLLASRRRG